MSLAKNGSRHMDKRPGERSPPGELARRGSVLVVALASLVLAAWVSPARAQADDDNPPLRLTPAQLALGDAVDDPGYLDVGAGIYDLMGDHGDHQTFAASVEYHFAQKLFFIGPAVGVLANARGGGMVYVGLYSDIALGPVVLTPFGGLGAWWHGNHVDENLGGTFEFRLSLTAAFQFEDRSRLGVRFGHISSADINRHNPGDNDLMLTYALPVQL